tara:strand:- start:541 stop:867 length:327 start_codon:yes stop_codon:yes gene_type:complete
MAKYKIHNVDDRKRLRVEKVGKVKGASHPKGRTYVSGKKGLKAANLVDKDIKIKGGKGAKVTGRKQWGGGRETSQERSRRLQDTKKKHGGKVGQSIKTYSSGGYVEGK